MAAISLPRLLQPNQLHTFRSSRAERIRTLARVQTRRSCKPEVQIDGKHVCRTNILLVCCRQFCLVPRLKEGSGLGPELHCQRTGLAHPSMAVCRKVSQSMVSQGCFWIYWPLGLAGTETIFSALTAMHRSDRSILTLGFCGQEQKRREMERMRNHKIETFPSETIR